MKKILLATICAASFSAGAYANERELNQDTFIKRAAISNMFEIESSKLAVEKSQNAEVKAYANKMISDHRKAGEGLKAAVSEAKLDKDIIPTRLDERHQQKLNTLKSKSGEEFDETYVDMQEASHDKAVKLYENFSENDAHSGPVKTFAAVTLPTLKQHEEHSDDLDDKVGGWWDLD